MKKYLIVKIAAIGDVVMALPLIREIRRREPDAYITWVCGQSVKPLFENLPVDELLVIDEKKLLRGNKLEKFSVVLALWKKIAFRKFDLIALGHADRRYQLLTALTRADRTSAFNHTLGHMCPIPGRHHTDEYVRLIYPDLEKNRVIAPVHLDFPLKKEWEDILSLKKTVVLLPGGAKNMLADDACRRWPVERYAELAELLLRDGWQVILCGARSDEWVLPYFASLPIVNWIGKTGLQDMVAIFNHVDVVVTHDSGPMHLAGTATCKLIALFGPTNPMEKIPRRNGVHFEWRADQFPCCPCYDGKFYMTCKDNICLRNVEAKDIFKMFKQRAGRLVGR